MKFDYTTYYVKYYIIPILTSLLVGIGCILSIVYGIQHISEFFNTHRSVFDYVKELLGFAVFPVLLTATLNPLIHGGIFLYKEGITDAVTSKGIIEKLELKNIFGGKESYSRENAVFDARIWVNGERYTLMKAGDLYEGEKVGFTYLPKSHLILEIWDANDESIVIVKNENALEFQDLSRETHSPYPRKHE